MLVVLNLKFIFENDATENMLRAKITDVIRIIISANGTNAFSFKNIFENIFEDVFEDVFEDLLKQYLKYALKETTNVIITKKFIIFIVTLSK